MTTLGPDYFDQMYAASADPWGFSSRWYEQRKYAITLAMLPRERYGDAFEPGCSIGVLTQQLAPRCDRLLACDVAPAAVAAASRRTAAWPNAAVEQRVLPGDWPGGHFDLIVFSEILYYFGGADLQRVLGAGIGALRPGGTLIAVHWRHPVPEYPRSGDEVHGLLAGQPGLARLAEHREPDFVAEVYLRSDGEPVSVAQAGGLV
ncbi:MAG TPA: SAM-dependent methyltransferase [Streptosporangiaceae bacterium]